MQSSTFGASSAQNSASDEATSQNSSTYQPTQSDLLDLLNYHLDLFEQEFAKRYLSYEPLKHFFKIYINHFPGASALRAELMQTHAIPEARKILKKLNF